MATGARRAAVGLGRGAGGGSARVTGGASGCGVPVAGTVGGASGLGPPAAAAATPTASTQTATTGDHVSGRSMRRSDDGEMCRSTAALRCVAATTVVPPGLAVNEWGGAGRWPAAPQAFLTWLHHLAS